MGRILTTAHVIVASIMASGCAGFASASQAERAATNVAAPRGAAQGAQRGVVDCGDTLAVYFRTRCAHSGHRSSCRFHHSQNLATCPSASTALRSANSLRALAHRRLNADGSSYDWNDSWPLPEARDTFCE